MAGLYIHIPFCKKACHYCDFHFSTNQIIKSEMVRAISKELKMQKNYLDGEKIETLYFGGGTPSVLSEADFELLVQAVHTNYSLEDQIEFTVEANPDDIDPEKLGILQKFEVNRLSIGIQSFDDTVLKFLNRSHDSKQSIRAIHDAREAGFKNINIDLIYAIPGRGKVGLKKDLDRLIELDPEHVSAYSLTVEEKTVFGKWTKKNRFAPVSEVENVEQFDLTMDILEKVGYQHYEISNYAKPGFLSHHNSNYWKQKKYLGVGPSAHSYSGHLRQANVSNNYSYLKAIAADLIPAETEALTPENKINEYLMTSLRTSEGCNLSLLKDNYQYDILLSQKSYVDLCLQKQLILLQNGYLILTRSGKRLADKISSDLFLIS